MKLYTTAVLLLCIFCSNCIADDNSKRVVIEEMFALTGVTHVADNIKKSIDKSMLDNLNEMKSKKIKSREADLIVEEYNRKITNLVNDNITWATIEQKLLNTYIKFSETHIKKLNAFFKTELGQRVVAEHENMGFESKRKYPASEELFKTNDGKDILSFLAQLFRGADKIAQDEFAPKSKDLFTLMAAAKNDLDKIPNKRKHQE